MLLPTHLQSRRQVIYQNDRVLVVFNAEGPYTTTHTNIKPTIPLEKCAPTCQPTIASNTKPYLCTTPATPSYAGAVIGGLQVSTRRLNIVKEGAHFKLNPMTAARWATIERILKDLALALLCSTDAPYIPVDYMFPVSPRRSGYLDAFPTKAAARAAARASREAFLPLIAHVAWAAIAHRFMYRARKPNANIEELDEGWAETLRKKYDVEPAWITDLKLSCVCDFTMLRAGVIIERPAEWAYSDRIPALIEANIPVWLVVTDSSGPKELQVWPSDLLPLKPTPTEIQSAQKAAALAAEARRRIATSIDNNNGRKPGTAEEDAPLDFHKWIKRKRESVATAMEHGAADMQRKWKDRAAAAAEKMTCPGIQSSNVYEWTRGDGGGYKRQRVPPACVEDVWRLYGDKQRWFNCIANVWELCVELDPADSAVHAGGDSTDEDGPIIHSSEIIEDVRPDESAEEAKLELCKDVDEMTIDDSTVNLTVIGESVPAVADISGEGGLGYDAYRLMSVRFGFSCTGFVYSSPQKKPLKLQKAMKIIGDSHVSPTYALSAGMEASFVHFVMFLLDTGQESGELSPPSPSLKKLCDSTLYSESLFRNESSTIRLQRASAEGKTLYLLHHTYDSEHEWNLAVWDPCTALQLLRCNPTTLSDAVMDLVEARTPFFTLKRLREDYYTERQNETTRPRSRFHWMKSRLGLGLRPPGHILGISDFKAYEITRNRLLENKRVARAAIKRGGILSRLAATVLDDCDLLEGPGPEGFVCEDHLVMNVTIDNEVHIMYDDDISQQEMVTLVGLYNIFDYNRGAPSEQSWWPSASKYEESGLNMGVWTPRCEEWYQLRRSRILAGTNEPLSASKWRVSIRGEMETKRLLRGARKFASEIIDQYLAKFYVVN